jgi:SAM-dependent methyltransferase
MKRAIPAAGVTLNEILELTNDRLYDAIGKRYSSRRRTDPKVFSQILAALEMCDTVLNVGAGTGSYEPTTCRLAVEPSMRMIAQRLPGSAPCVQGVAERLPLEDRSFDGSLASLTIHHWSDIPAGLSEMRRVTRKRIVLFTWDPEFRADFWLTRDYLPEILELDRPRFPRIKELERILGKVEVQPVPIPHDCQDGFTGAYWRRPTAYLDPVVQTTTSAMALLDAEIVRKAVDRLGEDLRTARWSARNGELQAQTSLDLGYRLIISDLARIIR